MPEQVDRAGAFPASSDGGGRAIDVYLADIAARLPGHRRGRGALLAELHDGLVDAVDHYCARGMPPRLAADRAVRDCGSVEVVSRAYAELLVDCHARRTALALLATGPLIGGLWLITLVPGDTPDALFETTPALGILVAMAAAAAAVTIAATGRLRTLLPESFRLAQKAAGMACVTTVVVDAGILGIAAVHGLSAPTELPWVLGLTAAAASCTRLICSQHAARLHLRRAFADPA